MRKPEADMPTEWDKHLRSSDRRIYYHRLRHRIREDTLKELKNGYHDRVDEDN